MTSHKDEAMAALKDLCARLDGSNNLRREIVEWWALANYALRQVQAIEELKRPRRAKKEPALADLAGVAESLTGAAPRGAAKKEAASG